MGQTTERRKLNLVSWDKITRPQDWGGLGIRRMKELNVAFLMKLCWGLVNDGNQLWIQVLRTKYNSSREGTATFSVGVVWRDMGWWSWQIVAAMRQVWQTMKDKSWTTGAGYLVSFWHDLWLPHHSDLMEMAIGQIPEEWKKSHGQQICGWKHVMEVGYVLQDYYVSPLSLQ